MHTIRDCDLTSNNTLGLASLARSATVIEVASSVEDAVLCAERRSLPLRVLGEGSNVILSPYIDALVALMRIKGCTVIGRTKYATLVSAGAGMIWHDLVEWTLNAGLPGLENLAGIPGTVGAAPVQNIGAYGLEIASCIESLLAFDTKRKDMRCIRREDCGFSYRDSVFKRAPGRYVIVEVTLALPHNWQPRLDYAGLQGLERATAHQIKDEILRLRRTKLPDWRQTGNVGSFFHNPVVKIADAERLRARFPTMPVFPVSASSTKLSAGWLIDQCNLKGICWGGAGIYSRHALVIVNHGTATQGDIAGLANHIRTQVLERFGIALAQEPEWL